MAQGIEVVGLGSHPWLPLGFERVHCSASDLLLLLALGKLFACPQGYMGALVEDPQPKPEKGVVDGGDVAGTCLRDG